MLHAFTPPHRGFVNRTTAVLGCVAKYMTRRSYPATQPICLRERPKPSRERVLSWPSCSNSPGKDRSPPRHSSSPGLSSLAVRCGYPHGKNIYFL